MADSPQPHQQSTDSVTWPDGVPVAGELIGGKYVCERMLGTGGMGAVIAARHSQLGQQVAIKVLLPAALNDPHATERFLREARAAISFRSEHVARVIDFGTLESSSPYLVMEFLEGCDLKQLLVQDGPLPIESAVDYVMHACEALCEAHRRGVVHRDLKPANLFLSSRVDGTPHVKVLDFGISKTVSLATAATGAGGGITRTDAVFGTPAYMSPEQLRSSKLVDHRTDVWSLGVSLYELLTGVLPFGSPGDGIVSMCAHILEDPPAPMATLRPGVPPGLDAAVQRCLAKSALERFSSMAELAEALSPFASPASAETAARIARMSVDSLPFESTVRSDSGQLSGPRTPVTPGAWGKSKATPARVPMGRVAAIAAGMAILGGAMGVAWMVASPNPAAQTVSAVAQGSSASSPVIATSATGGEAAQGTPSAVTSPSATDSAVAFAPPSASAPSARIPPTSRATSGAVASAGPAPPKSSTPAAPACAPGQAMSNGHCCPLGFEWKGGDCVPGVAKGFSP